MTRNQRLRLLRVDITPRVRRYVRLMDRFNYVDDVPTLRKLSFETERMILDFAQSGPSGFEEYELASHLLHTMEREDELRRRLD